MFHCKCQVELDEMMPEFGMVLGDDFLPEDLGEALRKGCIQYPSKTQLLGCWEVEKVFWGSEKINSSREVGENMSYPLEGKWSEWLEQGGCSRDV